MLGHNCTLKNLFEAIKKKEPKPKTEAKPVNPEKELKASLKEEQAKPKPNKAKVKNLQQEIKKVELTDAEKLAKKLDSEELRIKKLLARALEDNPAVITLDGSKKVKPNGIELSDDHRKVETFARERLQAKGQLRNLLTTKDHPHISEPKNYKFTATERDLVEQLMAQKKAKNADVAKQEAIKKRLARALEDDPTVPRPKTEKTGPELTADEKTVENFARERLRAKAHIRNVLEPGQKQTVKQPYKFTAAERDLLEQLKNGAETRERQTKLKKLLAKAIADDPTSPKVAQIKKRLSLSPEEEAVENFARERLRAKAHIRSLLEPKTASKAAKVPYKFTQTERDLVGQLEAEKNSPAGKLAKRVEGHIDTQGPKALTPEQEMVNTLFKVAKETLPEKAKLSPKDPLDAIVKAVKNKAEYAEIYQKAKDIVSKKFENDARAQNALKAYTEKHLERPYSEAQLTKTVEQHIKSNEVDIKALVKQHYFKVNETLGSLEKTLVDKAGFTDEEAKLFAGHIQKELGAKVNQAKQTQLKALLKEAPPFVRRPLAARINELANLGALNEQTYRQAVAKKLGLASLDEDVAKKIYSAASELQNTSGKRNREVKSAQLLKLIADQVPASGLRKVSTLQTMAQLLNPKTAIRNVVGNGLFAAVESGSNVAASIIDLGVSKITGKRTIVLPRLKSAGSGFVRGAKEGLQEAKLGINTQNTQFDLPKGQVFKAPVLQKLETALHFELAAPDKAFYGMAYRESVMNQLQAAGKNARITPEILARAQYEALYKTFQDESTAAKIFTKLKEALNVKQDFGLGDAILKYPKTPGNLLSRGLDYSPVGFAKAIYEPLKPLINKGKFDQRQFSQSMARALVGSGGVMGVGYTLGKLGLATGQQDADKDISKAKKLQGTKPYSLNRDGLLRFAMSGMNPQSAKPQAGDTWISYDWAQPISISFAAGVNVAQGGHKTEPQQIQDGLTTALKATVEGADTLTNQSVMQGLQKTFSGRDDEGRPSPTAGVLDVAASAPSGFVPTFLKQFNDVTDNTARETYDPNKFAQSFNQVKAKIPGLSQTLPARINTYGQPDEKYQDGSNNAFNVFLNPAFVSKLKSDPTGDEVVRLYEDAGETQQAPQTAPKKITITQHGQHQKIQLTPQQLGEYQTYIGQGSKRILDSVVQMPAYQKLSDEGKASLMASLITDVNTAAKISIFKHHPTARPTYVTMGILRNSKGLVMAGIRKHFISEYRSEIKQRRAANGP